ncbi:hypothetical protein ACGFNU_09400 [Spirillospora sp. NPDC048911]|uniref:hypothetical protein n=1 Tax=Spirillospora sp. NPDC048911 TaxID=3364527 RepID=UPI00371A30BB
MNRLLTLGAGGGLLCVALLAAFAATGDETPRTPSSSETTEFSQPRFTRPPLFDPGTSPDSTGIEGARAALQAVLRGHAHGDVSACRYVDPRGPFAMSKNGPLRGKCTKGMRDGPHDLRPRERQGLWEIKVTGGRLTSPTEAVIPSTGLQYDSGIFISPQPTFTLRRFEGRWKVVK